MKGPAPRRHSGEPERVPARKRIPAVQVRDQTLKTVNRVNSSEALPGLSTSWPIGDRARMEYVRALGKLGDPKAIPILVKGLEDEAWRVRHASAGALGKIGGPEAVTALERGLEDDVWDVFRACVYALRQIAKRG